MRFRRYTRLISFETLSGELAVTVLTYCSTIYLPISIRQLRALKPRRTSFGRASRSPTRLARLDPAAAAALHAETIPYYFSRRARTGFRVAFEGWPRCQPRFDVPTDKQGPLSCSTCLAEINCQANLAVSRPVQESWRSGTQCHIVVRLRAAYA